VGALLRHLPGLDRHAHCVRGNRRRASGSVIMTLADLRKLTIRKQLRIRFALRNGMECIVTEQGVAKVPALRNVADFNLDEELASATEFILDSAAPAKVPVKKAEPPRRIQRTELAAMFADSPSAPVAHEHDDE